MEFLQNSNWTFREYAAEEYIHLSIDWNDWHS